MKLILLAVLVFMSGCSAKTSEEDLKVKVISTFADTLVDALKPSDAAAYQGIWVKSGDEFADINGHPLLVSIPIKDEVFQKSDEIIVGFKKEREKLLAYLGRDLSNLQASKTEYIIKNDPMSRQSRLFEFELRITLKNGNHSCLLVQPSCVMTKRGVVIGDYFTLQAESQN